MTEFGSLELLAQHLISETTSGLAKVEQGLDRSAALIEKTAKEEIGHYQEAMGLFQEWPELANSTKADRVRKGFTENDPGLRNGRMRDSITREVDRHEAIIGSNDDHLLWFELGTNKQPPRPVLGTALYRNIEQVQRLVGSAVVSGLIGSTKNEDDKGYDRQI